MRKIAKKTVAKRVTKKRKIINTPDTWGVVIYSLCDEKARFRYCYVSNECRGSLEERAAASRNDFIYYNGRPNKTKKPYKPSEVTVLDMVTYPAAIGDLIEAVVRVTPVERVAQALRICLAAVGAPSDSAGRARADEFSFRKDW